MLLHRVVPLLSLLVLSTTLPSRAQTVHVDSLTSLIMPIALGEETEHGRRMIPEQELTVGFVSTVDEYLTYRPSIDHTRYYQSFAPTPFYDTDDFGALEAAVLHVPEKAQMITVLNNYEHETSRAVVIVWDQDENVLTLRHLLAETFSAGIGHTGADAYALFPDGSVLLAVRFIGEGIWHTVEFIRITDDGRFTRLLQHEFVMDPELENRLARQGGSSKIPLPMRGLGYTLSNALQRTPTVALTALKQAVVPVYGSMEEQPILDQEATPEIIDLWELAQQQ